MIHSVFVEKDGKCFPLQSWFNDLTSYLKGKLPWIIIIHFQVCCSFSLKITNTTGMYILIMSTFSAWPAPCYHAWCFFHTCLNFLNDPILFLCLLLILNNTSLWISKLYLNHQSFLVTSNNSGVMMIHNGTIFYPRYIFPLTPQYSCKIVMKHS